MKDYLFYTVYDAQEYEKMIKDLERCFRSSPEYRKWLSTIKRDVCAATGLTYDEDNAPIEIHHYHKTLYDICQSVIDYFLDNQLPLNVLYLSFVVFDLHMSGCVTYVPLLHCIHKMLHENQDQVLMKYPSIEENIIHAKSNMENILDYHKDMLLNHFKLEK